jgi:hypothetical protein
MTSPESDQKVLYEALLYLPWLPAGARNALMARLGISRHDENREITKHQSEEAEVLLQIMKERGMQITGDKGALDLLARRIVKAESALDQQLKRHRRRTKKEGDK